MVERHFLVRAAAQLHEVEPVIFELTAEVPALGGVEAAFLELNAIDFDAEDESGRYAVADRAPHLEDDARSVFQIASVLIGAFVGGWGEELGDEVTTGWFSCEPHRIVGGGGRKEVVSKLD